MSPDLPAETVDGFTDRDSGVMIRVSRYANGDVLLWVVDPSYGGTSYARIPLHELADDPQSDGYVRKLMADAERRCHGRRSDGHRCRSFVNDGTGYCRHHAGQVSA